MEIRKVPIGDRVKFYGLVFGTVAALAGAYKAYLEAKEENIARDMYKVNVDLISRLNDESHKNHEDILALREYLDRHVTGTTSNATPSASSSVGPVASAAPAPPPPVVKAHPAAIKFVKAPQKGEAPPAGPLVVVDANGYHQVQAPDEWP